jgi:C_GCAxxG_C_C family probable redox protein
VIKTLGAFGGGLGGNGEVCGALVGALAVLGLRFSRGKEEEKEDPRMWKHTKQLLKRFREDASPKPGHILCREIAGVDWEDRSQVKKFYEGEKALACRRLVGDTARLIGELLEQS